MRSDGHLSEGRTLSMGPLPDVLSTGLLVVAPVAAPLLAWRSSSRTGRVSDGAVRGIVAGGVIATLALVIPTDGRGEDGLEGLASIFLGGVELALVSVGSLVASVVAASFAAVRAQQR